VAHRVFYIYILSLAFVKRYSELSKVNDNSTLEKIGRGYFIEDIHLLQTMGVVSGFLSVVVFSLYVDSPDVSLLYFKSENIVDNELLIPVLDKPDLDAYCSGQND
jgi:hypothetical protein